MIRAAGILVAALLVVAVLGLPADAGTGTPQPTPHTLSAAYRRTLHPRVQCGGGDGTVTWDGWGSITVRGYLKYSGDVYNYCPSGRVYMYLSWSNLGSSHNKRIGSAGPGRNTRAHFSTRSRFVSYTHVRLTACTGYGGWHCGKPVGP